MNDEHVYRYPHRVTWPVGLICGLAVLWAALSVARVALLLLWQRWPVDRFLLNRVPRLEELIAWMERTGPRQITPQTFVTPLLWLLLALFVSLIFRNLFPPVRFSSRGLLVGFAGDWVPLRWEGMRTIRVTDTAGGKRFVVLVETDQKDLTPWHRLYSFLYSLGLKRGFLISSAMQDGEKLLQDIMGEITRRKRLGDKLNVEMTEARPSLLFGLLLGRSGLLGGTRNNDKPIFQPVATAATMGSSAAMTMPSMGSVAAALHAAPATTNSTPTPATTARAGDTIRADYPRSLQVVLNALTVVIIGLALWRYLIAWTTFLIFTFPSLQDAALFRSVPIEPLVSRWGLLIGAHLALLLVTGFVIMLRHLFPAVAVDSTGILFTALGRSHHLTWEQVSFVKATDVRAEKHVILVEAEGKHLPWYYLMGSWLYDGGSGRGALIWPMLPQFEPLMQRIALELTKRQHPDAPLKLRDDLPGWLLLLVVRPADALDRLVMLYDAERDMPQALETGATLRAGMRMLWVAAGPAALLLLYWMMYKGQILLLQVPLMMFLSIVWGAAEWPLASFLASSLDQVMGVGNKGYQGLYIYPTAQLPRLLPLGLAILLTLMGFPTLAIGVWAAGIAWSGLLTAGLWEALYGWRGPLLLSGSVMTVFFQILTLIGVLVLRG